MAHAGINPSRISRAHTTAGTDIDLNLEPTTGIARGPKGITVFTDAATFAYNLDDTAGTLVSFALTGAPVYLPISPASIDATTTSGTVILVYY